MDYEGIIDLDKYKGKSGTFWELTKMTFEDYFLGVYVNRSISLRIMYNGHLFNLKVYKNRYKREIDIYYDTCIKYKLKENESEFSTSCEELIDGTLKISAASKNKSVYLLEFIDAVSICFGVNRLYLIDGATSKLNDDIDLTLYMVMRYGKTFYERYGFKFCEDNKDIQNQKKLLELFDFKVFYSLLDETQEAFVKKRLESLGKNKRDYKFLGQFYVDAYDYLNSKASVKRLLQLQGLLTDPTKPWYSMVSEITQKKICMEKFYS